MWIFVAAIASFLVGAVAFRFFQMKVLKSRDREKGKDAKFHQQAHIRHQQELSDWGVIPANIPYLIDSTHDRLILRLGDSLRIDTYDLSNRKILSSKELHFNKEQSLLLDFVLWSFKRGFPMD